MRGDFLQRLDAGYDSVAQIVKDRIQVGVILGSGLQDFGNRIDGVEIPYSSIKGFPLATVEGHQGTLKIGERVALFLGRFHYYEGYSFDEVALPVFLMKKLGAKFLVVTNAAGAVNTAFRPGELILIRDHINLMGANPLRGSNPEHLGPRFPDMSGAYPTDVREKIRAQVYSSSATMLKEGVYAALPGPAYETPAEVAMLRKLGADMVGMSTVPEVIAAVYLGLRVFGISCITNMAAGVYDKSCDKPLAHHKIIEVGKRVSKDIEHLLDTVLQLFSQDTTKCEV